MAFDASVSTQYNYIDFSTYSVSPYTKAGFVAQSAANNSVDELVVVGQRPLDWPTGNIPVGSIAYQDGYYGIWKYLPDGNVNPEYTYSQQNDHIIQIDVSASNTPAAIQTLLRIAPAVALVSSKLATLSESQTINTAAGAVRGGDAQSVWNWINIKIVDHIAGTSDADAAMTWDFQPDGTYGPTMMITPNILQTYGSSQYYPGDLGINYVLMHEIAHMTTPGNQAFNTQYVEYLNHGGDRDHFNDLPMNQYHKAVEIAADQIAIALADFVGLPVTHETTLGLGW